jgi:betaine-aldehyde dehydrogenase|tara:strand:- start:8398 stop:9969 length:1572 start_codon:yes stop_codon:yes gene_type:complete
MAAPPPGRCGRVEQFINNAWVRAPQAAAQAQALGGAARTLPVVNPHDNKIIGAVGAGDRAMIDDAVRAARKGYKVWSATPGRERSRVLREIARGIERRKRALAELETLDAGKPIEESEWDIDDVSACFDYYADRCDEVFGDKAYAEEDVKLPMDEFAGRLRREALGVIGLITPWNYPLLMATWKVAPALASGCAVVLKPSELASLTCQVLGDVCVEAGLPPGAFNVVTGRGDEAGAALCAHKGVDKISFTGSLQTGRIIMSACAKDVKPVSLELGGKSALVIFDDCDLEKAVEWALFGCFWTNGQICSATSRVFIHERIREKFLARLKEAAEAIPYGNPLVKGCRLGPLVSEGQYKKVMKMVERAKRKGYTLLTGGKKPSDPDCREGFYLEPTVFVDVPMDAEVWREEIFGPVMCVKTFASETEVVAMANDSDYALAAAVITDDLARRERMTAAFDTGIVWVNCSQPCFAQLPWGGRKRSGFGRDLGANGMDKYLHQKQVVTYVSEDPFAWYPMFDAKPNSKL